MDPSPSSSHDAIDPPEIARPIVDLARALEIEWPELEPWLARTRACEMRRDLPEDAPILTVFFGPTGVGKSTLFNLICGEEIARASAIRPTTSIPVAVGRSVDLERVVAERGLSIELESHALDDSKIASLVFDRQVLVDTPDFDSVDLENRARALELFHAADRIVIVLSPEKYGDQTVWSLVDEVRDLGNFAVTIFNKSSGGDALADASRLSSERGLPNLIEIERVAEPSPDGFGSGPRDRLREVVECGTSASEILDARLESAVNAERAQRTSAVEPFVESLGRTAARVEAEIDEWSSSLTALARDTVHLEADGALRKDLEARVLEQVSKLDILRVPRQWLFAPFRGLFGGEKNDARAGSNATDWLIPVYRDRYTEFALDAVRSLRRIATTAAEGTRLNVPWPEAEDPGEEVLRDELAKVLEAFGQDVRAESEALTKGLPLRGKLQFYGTQAVFHTLVAGVCVKTGGLTGGEVLTQTIATPVVAKAVGGVVSNQETRVIEERLRDRFAERVAQSVHALATPLSDRLELVRTFVPESGAEAGDWSARVRAWESSFESRLR